MASNAAVFFAGAGTTFVILAQDLAVGWYSRRQHLTTGRPLVERTQGRHSPLG